MLRETTGIWTTRFKFQLLFRCDGKMTLSANLLAKIRLLRNRVRQFLIMFFAYFSSSFEERGRFSLSLLTPDVDVTFARRLYYHRRQKNDFYFFSAGVGVNSCYVKIVGSALFFVIIKWIFWQKLWSFLYHFCILLMPFSKSSSVS